MNSTSPLETIIENAIASQLIAHIPSNPIYATVGLLTILVLTHFGSWFHLSQNFSNVIQKCLSKEEEAATPTVPYSDDKSPVYKHVYTINEDGTVSAKIVPPDYVPEGDEVSHL